MRPGNARRIALRAREASRILATLSRKKRNAALSRMAVLLVARTKELLRANARDIRAAREGRLSAAMIGRLEINPETIKKIAHGLVQIARLADPLNRVLERRNRPNGLKIEKVSVPLGVLLVIFESRPNVTADCAGLAVKSGNAVILKGGSEAFHTNTAIHAALSEGLRSEGVPQGAVEFVASRDRRDISALLGMDDLINLVIPRGGESLIRAVARESRIPVIKHYKGICHVYVDRDADLDMALRIAENAKVENPGVCNAMETLLVHRGIAQKFLPRMASILIKKNVELRGDSEARKIVKAMRPATERDWRTEYLDLILSIRVVGGVDEAVRHIQEYGSAHSDSIVSRNPKTIEQFTKNLDSACVFVNCSTRFADGGEFGMGAEIGISTDKLHARGPMGLRELTSYKYVVRGNGQIRT